MTGPGINIPAELLRACLYIKHSGLYIADFFRALGTENILRIIRMLRDGPHSALDAIQRFVALRCRQRPHAHGAHSHETILRRSNHDHVAAGRAHFHMCFVGDDLGLLTL